MRKILPLVMMILILSSCSRESSSSTTMLKGTYPDLVMTNAESTVGQESGSPIILNAGRMTLYSSDGYALLEDFSFTSLSEEGEIETEGKADKGNIELDGSRIELEGNVVFSRPGDNMLVKAESMIYNRESDEITTVGAVMVSSDEGTIEGDDFKGDLRRNLYSFSNIRKGDFNIE